MIMDVTIMLSGDIHAFNTEIMLNKMKEQVYAHYILFHPKEFHTPQFMEYLEWNYDLNKNHPKNVSELENFLIDNNSNLYVILGGDERSKSYENIKKYPIKNVNFLFWSTFLLHYSYYGLEYKLPIYKDKFPLKNIDKLFLCLNGKPRYHRAKFIDQLVKNDLFSIGVVSWNRVGVEEYEFKYFENITTKLDGFVYIDLSTVYSEKLLSDVLFNIVTESSTHNDMLFYTEKTFRTLLIGQPFLILGAANQNLGLKKYGFELYDNAFDYGFDNSEDLDHRISGIIYNLEKYKHKYYNEIYKNLLERITFNKLKALEIVNTDPFIPEILVHFYKKYGLEFIKLFNKFSTSYNASYRLDDNFDIIEEILKKNKWKAY